MLSIITCIYLTANFVSILAYPTVTFIFPNQFFIYLWGWLLYYVQIVSIHLPHAKPSVFDVYSTQVFLRYKKILEFSLILLIGSITPLSQCLLTFPFIFFFFLLQQTNDSIQFFFFLCLPHNTKTIFISEHFDYYSYAIRVYKRDSLFKLTSVGVDMFLLLQPYSLYRFYNKNVHTNVHMCVEAYYIAHTYTHTHIKTIIWLFTQEYE